jgi:hypothetical protein
MQKWCKNDAGMVQSDAKRLPSHAQYNKNSTKVQREYSTSTTGVQQELNRDTTKAQ